MTEETRKIQLANQIKFGSRSFRSIEQEDVHDFHPKQFSCWQAWNNSILQNHLTSNWGIKYVQCFKIITWIITSYLESFYTHNQLFARDNKVEVEWTTRKLVA